MYNNKQNSIKLRGVGPFLQADLFNWPFCTLFPKIFTLHVESEISICHK